MAKKSATSPPWEPARRRRRRQLVAPDAGPASFALCARRARYWAKSTIVAVAPLIGFLPNITFALHDATGFASYQVFAENNEMSLACTRNPLEKFYD
jgi:hypothetical protein